MNIKETIGKRIKELRDKKKISQEKLAELADLDRTYINTVERGKRNISIENIEKIATALDCTLQEFFKSELFNKKT
ncbi:MAG: helix-turn-helix transcriptional regulator [Ignavibacteriales bacterium]|nr:MAG: helix-turn-helix transcriptional regulator [Ignavibacteriales bacterium]